MNGHSQKNYSLSASVNFDFLTEGLGTNDAGIGFTVHSNLFAKKKLQLRTEVSLDYFIGDKVYYTDMQGNTSPSNPVAVNLKAGPEFFITNKISFAALYGYIRYEYAWQIVHSGDFKFVLTMRPPKHQRMLIGFQFSTLTGDYSNVHYWAISIGCKIL